MTSAPLDATRPLVGRVAVVTGGARGQGRSHALGLARLGADVVLVDVPGPMDSVRYPLSNTADLETTLALVQEIGVQGLGVEADVRDARAMEAAVDQTLERFGRLDILLANAGIATQSPIADMTEETWTETIETNLTGTFHVIRAVLPAMKAQQYGRIVVTASMGARKGIPNIGHYVASKWGVIGLAKSVALEVLRDGITVNVVCPTTVATPMVLNEETYRLFGGDEPGSLDAAAVERNFTRHHPVPEPWIEPEDVTREVLHLVTERGAVTGSVVEIGLGLSAQLP